jgi:chromosome segregation ATPase
MANVQDPPQLLRIFQHHPALATLLTSSIAGPLFGLWTHNGAPVPGYGRLLTQAEAHTPVVNTGFHPAPNILPVHIFGHPHTISYSAAPRTISYSAASRFASSSGKVDIPLPPLVNATAGYSHASSDTGNIVNLTQALVGVVGAAAVVALLALVFKSRRAKKMPVTDKDLMDFLQVKLMQATNKTADVEDKLEIIQAQFESLKGNLNFSERNLRAARNEVVKLRSDIEGCNEVNKKHLRKIDRLGLEIEDRTTAHYATMADLSAEKEAALDAVAYRQLVQERTADLRKKNATIAKLEQEKMDLNDKIMELNASIERPVADLREANHQLTLLQTTITDLKQTCTERTATLAKLIEEKAELFATLNTQTQAHAIERQALQDKIEDTVELVEDRGREIRALDSKYLKLRSKMSEYDICQDKLSRRLRDMHEQNCALQQANIGTDKQPHLRIYEHGLGVHALDAERESSEYDLVVAVDALVSSHQEERRQILSQVEVNSKDAADTQALLTTALAAVEGLRQEAEYQSGLVSSKDDEFTKLLQEREMTAAEIARLSLDKDNIAKELHEAKRSSREKSGVIDNIRIEKEKLSAQLDMSGTYLKNISSELDQMQKDKKLISNRLASSEQTNDKRDADLARAQQENDVLSSKIQVLTDQQVKNEQHLKDQLAIAADEKNKLEKLESEHSDLRDQHEKLESEKEEATKQVEDTRNMYEQSEDKVKDLQGKLADVDSLSLSLQQAEEQKADFKLECKKSADDLAALRRELEDANARSTSLQLAIDEQKASFELDREKSAEQIKILEQVNEEQKTDSQLERKKSVDNMNILQQAHDNLEKNLKQTKESHNTAVASMEEQKSTNAQLRQQLQQQQADVESKDQTLTEFKDQLQDLNKKVDKYVKDRQQLEEHLDQKSQETVGLRSEHTAELDRLVSNYEKQLGKIPDLKQDLDKVTMELTSSHHQVQELQAQRDAAVDLQPFQNEQQLGHIKYLETSLDNAKLELTNTQSKMHELQDQHTQEVAQKDEDINEKIKELDERRSQVKELTNCRKESRERISELEQQHAIIVNARAAEAAKLDNDATTTDTPTSANTADPETDRLQSESSLNWSKRSRRDDWKWCVRAGIVQQGPYPDRQLIQPTLPHADSFYFNLPVPIPKPCTGSDEGEKHTCEQCLETYVKAAFHDHGPLCMLFFSNHAATCKYCEKPFVLNSAFQEHEKYCGKYRTPGAAPEVLAHLPSVDEFAILEAHMTLLPPSPPLSDIMSLKITTLGPVSTNTLIRAILPHADPDFSPCNLPKPVAQHAVLPNNFRGDTYAGKKYCHHCSEWYILSEFQPHLDTCASFFQGRGNSSHTSGASIAAMYIVRTPGLRSTRRCAHNMHRRQSVCGVTN